MMEAPYILMHKDIPVAVLMMDGTGTITDIGEHFNTAHLPIMCGGRAAGLKRWWQGRSIPVTRDGLIHDLTSGKAATTGELLLKNLGLSLTDSYWVKRFDEEYTWSQINLFEHVFLDRVIAMELSDRDELDMTGASPFIPSMSLKGELRKKWVIDDHRRVLIKGNAGDGIQQSLNEVFASRLHKRQGKFPFTDYHLVTIIDAGGMITGCSCDDFCDADTEFVSAYEITCSYKKRNDRSEYEAYIEYAATQGIDIRPFMEYQIAADFILTNTDRHFNNFGILRDADSLVWRGPAPIFDCGNSLFYRGEVPRGVGLYEIEVSSFRRRETDLLSYIRNPDILDIQALPSSDELYDLLEKDSNLTPMKREAICDGYTSKIHMYEDFKNGARIWEYRYRNQQTYHE